MNNHPFLHILDYFFPSIFLHKLTFFLFYLQRYKGDVSELELYFVIVNNEYGEHAEEELKVGGKNIRVTNDNVIQFIHLVANHRLNYQVMSCLILYFFFLAVIIIIMYIIYSSW